MVYFFGILVLIAAIGMVLAVLVQNSKGGGISSAFGISGATQLLGARRGAEIIEKITWGLAGAIAVLAFLVNMVATPAGSTTKRLRMTNSVDDLVIENATSIPSAEQLPQAQPEQAAPAQ